MTAGSAPRREHCESCGSTRPEDILDLEETEGYTACCNELVCSGGPSERWAVGQNHAEEPTRYVQACCGHKADRQVSRPDQILFRADPIRY